MSDKTTVDPVATFNVSATGDINWEYEGIRDPGYYAVVHYGDIERIPVVAPLKRVFHLGELRSLSSSQMMLLASKGLSDSNQILAVGMLNLCELLGEDLADTLSKLFSKLGMAIPMRRGEPVEKLSKKQISDLKEQYRAYRRVDKARDLLSDKYRQGVESTFVVHSAGVDLVCGACEQQAVSIPEADLAEYKCTKCGNQVGIDFRAKQERLKGSFIQAEEH